MPRHLGTVLRDQGRGVVGALVVSVELLFTMEMWWHGWQLPVEWLVAYVVAGLVVVLAVTRSVGFREEEETTQSGIRTAAFDFTEVLLQSFVTAYAVLLLFGIVDLGDPPMVVARLGLVFVVPLGFGAALANDLLRGAEEGHHEERPYYRQLGIYAAGALFVAWTMAPTDEMQLMAAYAGWFGVASVVVSSVLVTHLVLFELEFRGQQTRIADRGPVDQWGHTFVAYAVGVVVAAGLLASYGHFHDSPVSIWVQKTVVLGLPASLGASGARVVLA